MNNYKSYKELLNSLVTNGWLLYQDPETELKFWFYGSKRDGYYNHKAVALHIHNVTLWLETAYGSSRNWTAYAGDLGDRMLLKTIESTDCCVRPFPEGLTLELLEQLVERFK